MKVKPGEGKGDVVLVDGEPIKRKGYRLPGLNKPKGITCATDLKDKTNHRLREFQNKDIPDRAVGTKAQRRPDLLLPTTGIL